MNQRNITILVASIILIACFGVSSKVQADSEDLNITPRLQNTPVWCWVTVGQMVFEHYDIPNINPGNDYQCGIVGALAGPNHPCWSNCGKCIVSARSINQIKEMISFYPRAVQFLLKEPVPQLRAKSQGSPLSKARVKEEIDAGRPIIVGVSFDKSFRFTSQHVALIVGYDDDDEDEGLMLTVNDPFPYNLPQFSIQRDPYEVAGGEDNFDGSFKISYDDFKSGLNWKETIFDIR